MPSVSRSQWLTINYAVTIFISAFLLFQVQPIVSKYILPWFGGSPAVWTTCMLFFQTLLFAGYAYAHFSSQRLSPKQQALLHLAIILTALVMLRVVPGESWKPTDSTDPVGRILLLLAASVGLPYFVLSTTGPLVQSWFARSFPGRTPYRLYALSNLGSLLALLSYPVFFERIFDVPHQAAFWSWGFWIFALLCAVAAASLWRKVPSSDVSDPSRDPQEAEVGGVLVPSFPDGHHSVEPPHWWQYALWLILPALASVTLLATTNHVCTDVAVMPFLWVIPLSLYLLTFIIAFDHPRWYRPSWIALASLLVIYGTALGIGSTDLFDCGVVGRWLHSVCDLCAGAPGQTESPAIESPTIHVGLGLYLALNFVAMFCICLLYHGELVRLKPHPKYLTAFYLLISAGGAIGGIAVTLVAPHVFHTFYEWELATFIGYWLALGLLLRGLIQFALRSYRERSTGRVALAVVAIVVVLLADRIGWLDVTDYLQYPTEGVLLRTRNFFGTLLVREYDPGDPEHCIILKHGATTHGLQFLEGDHRGEATTYYTAFGGVGRTIRYLEGLPQVPALADNETHEPENLEAIAAVRQAEDAAYAQASKRPDDSAETDHAKTAAAPLRIGAVGLGAGTLAVYTRPGDSISFYEINPQVIDIADSGKWFTFLPDCRARAPSAT